MPTNAQINTYNDIVLEKVPRRSHTFPALDSLKEVGEADLSDVSPDTILDWSAVHNIPGLPTNKLVLKQGMVTHLMHNILIDYALLKNACLVIGGILGHVLTAKLLQPSFEPGRFPSYMDDELLAIPRITFQHVLHSGYTLICHQYPLELAYGTTFNSCQRLDAG